LLKPKSHKLLNKRKLQLLMKTTTKSMKKMMKTLILMMRNLISSVKKTKMTMKKV